MKTVVLEFPYNARTTYVATKRFFGKQTEFSSITYNNEQFVIQARRGMWLSPFSEKVTVKVVADSPHTSKVKIESASRSVLNLLNIGANSKNVSYISDCINNEAYKLLQDNEIAMRSPESIRIVQPDIKYRS